MRSARVVFVVLLLSPGCSLALDWDGVSHGMALDASSSPAHDGERDGGAASADAGGLAPVDPGAPCSVGGVYCGQDKVLGDPDVLYRCETQTSARALWRCQLGCEVHVAGEDDGCRCRPGALYCGGHEAFGDPTVLYRCSADGSAYVVAKRCTRKCNALAQGDDSCE